VICAVEGLELKETFNMALVIAAVAGAIVTLFAVNFTRSTQSVVPGVAAMVPITFTVAVVPVGLEKRSVPCPLMMTLLNE